MNLYFILMRKPWISNSVCFLIYAGVIAQIWLGYNNLGLVVYGILVGLVHLRTVRWRAEWKEEENLKITRGIIES